MKSTFEQLVKIVLPQLKLYENDLLVHDKAILENFDGKFIYGYRPTGTDLLRLQPDFETYYADITRHINDDDLEKLLLEEIIWITYADRNTKFMFFDGIKLIEITKDRAQMIHRSHILKVCQTYKMKQQLKKEQLNF